MPDLPSPLATAPREALGAIHWFRPAGCMLALTAVLACGDTPVCCPPPPGGFLQVTAVTTGANIDPDGYTLVTRPQIAGRDSLTRAVGVNATISWELEPATDVVRLKDVQSNCVVAGDNPRSLTIVKGDTVSTTFNVSCS